MNVCHKIIVDLSLLLRFMSCMRRQKEEEENTKTCVCEEVIKFCNHNFATKPITVKNFACAYAFTIYSASQPTTFWTIKTFSFLEVINASFNLQNICICRKCLQYSTKKHALVQFSIVLNNIFIRISRVLSFDMNMVVNISHKRLLSMFI